MKTQAVKAGISRNRPVRARVRRVEHPAVAKPVSRKAAAKSPVKAAAKPRPKAREKAHEKTVDTSSALLREIHEIRSLVSRAAVPPPVAADAALESAVDSVRRLLSEVIETRMESLLEELAAVRQGFSVGDPGGLAVGAVARLDGLLEKLGAVSFSANRADYVDPLIHIVLGETDAPDLPRGVIVDTVRSGCRSRRGRVLSRAGVIISRGN